MTQTANNRWIFDQIRLNNSPSKQDNIGYHEEMVLRQCGTNLIKDMAETLKLKSICMNTAIVYFHRFFTFRSFHRFDVNQISVCSLFVAAKWEEQPIFKEHIIKVSLICRKKTKNIREEDFNKLYSEECDKLVENENEMLLTFGFDLSVIHSQTVIINASQNNSVINKTICQKAYHIAGELLRLTTICLQFRPTFIACVCIYLSSDYLKIPITSTNSTTNWCHLIDTEITPEEVEGVAQRFKCYIIKSKLTDGLNESKKRTLSYESSPESAYSSGSGNSPDYDNSLPKPINKDIRTDRPFNPMINNNKRIQQKCEQSSTLNKNCVKLKQMSLLSKPPSINSHSKQPNPNIFPFNSSVNQKCGISGAQQSNQSDLQNKLKYRKVVKPNGELMRVPVPSSQSITSSSSAANITKNPNHLMSSSTKQTPNLSQNNVNNKLVAKKNLNLKNLNLKITFSTNTDNNKSNDSTNISNSRVVRETQIVSNSQQIGVQIES